MGDGYIFKCKSCGSEKHFFLGVGMLDYHFEDQINPGLKKHIIQEFGYIPHVEIWKRGRALYHCNKCNRCEAIERDLR